VTVLEGIRRRTGTAVSYAVGCRITAGRPGPAQWWQDEVELAEPGAQDALIAEATAVARAADLLVLVVGGNEGTAREGWWHDHLGDRDSLDLPGRQLDLLDAIAATGRPVVAIVMGGRPLNLTPLVERCAAVLQVWYPGQEGGTAIAEILYGDISPSGRLPISLPRSVGQLPVYYSQKWSARRGYLFGSQEPLFPFGHGLTYTTFSYQDMTIDPPTIERDQEATVSVTVVNTGPRPGTEVVQCYVSDRFASLTRPQRVLRGFSRIGLDPGESSRVSFALGPPDLALYARSREWVVEPGEFDIYVGGSAAARTRAVLTVH
jgi:beta-glucosidase